MTRPAFIYALQGEAGGPIKIGHSAAPLQRLLTMSAWTPERLVLLGATRGQRYQERMVHGHLAEAQSHGEWFHPSPPVLCVVEAIQTGGDLWRFCGDGSYDPQAAQRVGAARANLAARMAAVGSPDDKTGRPFDWWDDMIAALADVQRPLPEVFSIQCAEKQCAEAGHPAETPRWPWLVTPHRKLRPLSVTAPAPRLTAASLPFNGAAPFHPGESVARPDAPSSRSAAGTSPVPVVPGGVARIAGGARD